VEDLTPSQKGAVAEAEIAAAAIRLGYVVLRPLVEGSRYDLVIDLQPRLLRVQCKWARDVGGALNVTLKTSRCTPRGYVRTSYAADEIDAVAAWSPSERTCFLIASHEAVGRRSLQLRVAPTLNGQATGVKWARDYDFAEAIARERQVA
jgi:hypothetical protein